MSAPQGSLFKTSRGVDTDLILALGVAAHELLSLGWNRPEAAQVLRWPDRGGVTPEEQLAEVLKVINLFPTPFLRWCLTHGVPWHALKESAERKEWKSTDENPSRYPGRRGEPIMPYEIVEAFEELYSRGHLTVGNLRKWFGRAHTDPNLSGARERAGQETLAVDDVDGERPRGPLRVL